MTAGETRLPGRVRVLLSLILGVLAAFPGSAAAATPASIDAALDRAVLHLEQAQQTDGSVGARLAVRDTATAAEAVRAARPSSPFLAESLDFLGDEETSDVDSGARLAIATRAAADASDLLDEQRPDGGFGLSKEYESDPLDTALAIRALVIGDQRTAAKRALDRLLAFRTAGTWGSDGGEVLLTAEALLAVDAYVRRYGSSTAYDGALADGSAWLAGQQDAEGHWSTGTIAGRSTSTAITALAPFASYGGRVEAGADQLLATQRTDDSWGDPYSTGLAVRALVAAKASIERANRADLADPAIRARDLSADPATVEPGHDVTITAVVRNGGAGTASGVTAEFHLADPALGGDPVASTTVPDVVPGGAVSISETFAVAKPVGRHKVYVVLRTALDDDRDLANNRAALNLFVRSAKSIYAQTRDWPRPGRDMQRSGATPNRLHAVVDANPLWRHRADGQHIVAEGKVFFGQNQKVTARDAKTGELAWEGGPSYPAGDFRYRAPLYNRGFVYSAGIGNASIQSARTGEFAGGSSGWGGDIPIFGVEVIPVKGNYDPVFMYLAGKTWINGDGSHCRIWPYRDPSGGFNSDAWKGETRADGYVHAGYATFDRPCGDDQLAFSADSTRAYMASGDSLFSFDPVEGKDAEGTLNLGLWAVELPGVAKTDNAVLIDSLNQLVVTGWEGQGDDADESTPPNPDSVETGKGKLLAADPSNGAINWSFTTDARIDGSPIEYKGAIIVTDRSGRVYAVDQTTGTLKWSWVPPSWTAPAEAQQEKAGQTLARSGRYLYVPHVNGSLYTLDARNGNMLSATAFPARPYDLAIDDENNAIYVRTLDGWVGAYATQEQPQQCAPDPVNPEPAPGALERVSAEGDGAQLGVRGAALERPAFSGDGKQVAYVRETGDIYWEGTQIHIKHLETGETTEIPSETIEGTTKVFQKTSPVLSDDGRYLGFAAFQFDSVTGHIGDQPYVLDRVTGETEPVLKNPDGTIRPIDLENANPSEWNQYNPTISMSGDGRSVAFSTRSGLVPDDTDGQVDAYVVDRITGEATLASRTADPVLAPEHVWTPSLSRNGRYVAFNTYANLSDLPSTNTLYDTPYAFVFDRETGELEPVSVTGNGQAIAQGWSPYVSGDGSYVTFTSGSASLMPEPWRSEHSSWIGGSANAYVWSRATGKTSIITINDSEKVGRYNGPIRPTISDDGSYVAFQNVGFLTKTTTTRLTSQIAGRDLAGGNTKQISYNRWGVSGDAMSIAPTVSPDGRKVAFISAAKDLVTGDSNNVNDIFVLDRDKEPTSEAAFNDDEPVGPDCGPSSQPAVGYSDLNVTADDIRPGTLEQGQPGTVEVDVRNQGDTASEATTVRLYDGTAETGTLIAEQPLAGLAPGANATVEFSWSPVADAGSHRLTAVVDPGEAVFQQDFADDEATKDVDVVAPQLSLTATTSKPAYVADEDASFTAGITNASIAPRDATLELTVRDADGEHVGTVYDGPISLLAGGHVDIPATWDVQDTTAGNYSVQARLLNAGGDELKTATVAFAITADVDPALDFATSKSTYAAGETAQLRAIVKNDSVNAPLSGTKVEFSLTPPGSSTPQTWQQDAGDIAAGKAVLLTQDKSLAGLAPGTYPVSARLISSTGTTLVTKTGSFVLAASSVDGTGVTGTITATPTEPELGSNVTFAASATNGGNADITGARFRVKLHDVDTGALAKTVDDAVRTFGRTAPTTALIATATTGLTVDRSYQASLHLVLSSGTEVPLARAVIKIKPAPVVPVLPVTTGANFDTSARSGVLVWACDRADETAARAALSGTFASFVPDRTDPKYATTNGCGLFTSDEQKTLLRLLRSGNYNQIWLLGRSSFLELNLANEIASRVIHGDSLLIAGTSLGFDLNLLGNKSPLGATGNLLPLLPGSYSLAFPTGSPFAGASGTVVGLPTALNRSTAAVAATTTYGIWPLRTTSTLGTVNTFGNGKAIMFGASPKMFSSATDAANFLGKGKTALQPAASAVRPGGVVKLDLWVEGQSPGSPLEVRAELPAGAGLLEKPADVTLTGTTLTVPFSATGTARRTRSVWVKLPPAATSISVTQTAYAKNTAGTFVPVSPPATSSSLTVPATRAAAVTATQTALNAVTAPSSYERAKLDAIKAHVAAIAVEDPTWQVAQTRIATLLTDIGTIERASGWTNTTPAWKSIATLVTYVEFDYYRYGGQ